MNDLKIYWPHKPYLVTQRWGNPNGAYAAHFDDPSFKNHNGIDAVGRMTTLTDGVMRAEHPVYCPVEGFTVHKVQYAPQGGGNEIWLISDEPLQMFERKCHAYIAICHAKKVLVQAGDKPALGEMLLIADSTGFSTGLHTHMGLYRVDFDGIRVSKYHDQNEMNGSFDPVLFFTRQFAVDKATMATHVKNGFRYLGYLTGG